MRAFPFQEFRLRAHVGKPQRHAVVMRDREPHALGRKRQTAHRRRHIQRFLIAFRIADKGSLSGRPRHRTIVMERDVVDPAPLGIGCQDFDMGFRIKRHQLAIVAAHDNALAVGGRTQDAAAMHGNGIRLTASRQRDVFFRADERRDVAKEMHSGRRCIQRNLGDPISDRNNGGLFRRQAEVRHHAMVFSKPSRIACSGNSRPMNTTRLSRFSSLRHFR